MKKRFFVEEQLPNGKYVVIFRSDNYHEADQVFKTYPTNNYGVQVGFILNLDMHPFHGAMQKKGGVYERLLVL